MGPRVIGGRDQQWTARVGTSQRIEKKTRVRKTATRTMRNCTPICHVGLPAPTPAWSVKVRATYSNKTKQWPFHALLFTGVAPHPNTHTQPGASPPLLSWPLHMPRTTPYSLAHHERATCLADRLNASGPRSEQTHTAARQILLPVTRKAPQKLTH